MNGRPWVYYPQSVRIPEDAGVKRDIKVNRMTDARAGQPLDAPARSQYDSDTLFYDMFFASGELTCIGPPFVNLGSPKAILCDGEMLRFKNKGKRTPKYARLRIKIPARKQGRGRLDLRFCFSDFEVSASCDMGRASPLSLPHRDLCLALFQKENPAQWIRDWLLWHYRAHGIRRAVIYDNGSRDFPELGGAFSDLDAGLDVGLVHWPFPYGPLSSNHNKFSQAGALNHFRMFFGGSFDWGVNLDIDEYLFADRGEAPLAERLAQAQRRRQPVMYLEQRHFPRQSVREGRTPRFFHCHARYREKTMLSLSLRASKYIFQSGRTLSCGLHHAWFRGPGDLREIAGRLLLVWRRLRTALFKQEKRSLRWRLQPVLPPYLHNKVRTCNQRDYFFCHYRSLNTGWKAAVKNPGPYPGLGPEVSEIAPEFLTEDRRMAEQAAELGFRDADEENDDASTSKPAGPAPDA